MYKKTYIIPRLGIVERSHRFFFFVTARDPSTFQLIISDPMKGFVQYNDKTLSAVSGKTLEALCLLLYAGLLVGWYADVQESQTHQCEVVQHALWQGWLTEHGARLVTEKA